MIEAKKLSYSFPDKDLYNKISFTLEENQHCAFIGTNGTGKSTLINIIMDPEEYLYDGKLIIEENVRIGYVSQFSMFDKTEEVTVFEYLSKEFVTLQKEIEAICVEMETATDFDEVMERYQKALDASQAVDADNYESNIMKKLKLSELEQHRDTLISKLSGGEFKLLQIVKEMLTVPDLLIMDEPDGYLDFEHLNSLKDLINTHKGTMLVVTHNRYLLNHCFDKILHLENREIQEFDGKYIDYNFSLLQYKIERQEQAEKDTAEIERNMAVVNKLRAAATYYTDASRGRALKGRVSLLKRLEAGRTLAPFVDIKQPEIHFEAGQELEEDAVVLHVNDYSVAFKETLLEHVNFEIKAKEKVALIGANGTGKTTLLRDIFKNSKDSITIGNDVQVAFLSQLQGEMLTESNTIMDEFLELGFEKEQEVKEYLSGYGFEADVLKNKISALSGGEKNTLQLAKVSLSKANLLLLDEPTSHLDTYSQIALEQAINEYNGAVLMVSHDFYTIANCVDYVLMIEDKTVRKMSVRKFRKMIYANHFGKDYLELEQKKKELETKVEMALKDTNYEQARKVAEKLEEVIEKM